MTFLKILKSMLCSDGMHKINQRINEILVSFKRVGSRESGSNVTMRMSEENQRSEQAHIFLKISLALYTFNDFDRPTRYVLCQIIYKSYYLKWVEGSISRLLHG